MYFCSMKLRDILHQFYPLSDAAFARMEAIFDVERRPKDDVLFQPGSRCSDVRFVGEGLASTFTFHDDECFTYWLCPEGAPIIALNPYVRDTRSYEGFRMLEDSLLYRTTKAQLTRLYNEDIEIANFGRRLMEVELLEVEPWLIEMAKSPALKRYELLIENRPQLLQRVSQEHLAHYLGVTRVSLSRLRAQLAGKRK